MPGSRYQSWKGQGRDSSTFPFPWFRLFYLILSYPSFPGLSRVLSLSLTLSTWQTGCTSNWGLRVGDRKLGLCSRGGFGYGI